MSPTTKLDCPTCKSPIEWSDAFPFRPFCSERCKLIDLGEWASESHSIPGAAVDPLDLMSPNVNWDNN